MKKIFNYLMFSFLLLFSPLKGNSINAQPVLSDGTLSTQIQTNDNKNFEVSGGTEINNNLFHSFKALSLPDGGSIIFNNNSRVRNIFSRVTSTSPSNINGAIRTQGIANLFLLNPNGIIFNSGAMLNVGGSFLATTATSIEFSDGKQFGSNTKNLSLPNGIPALLQFSNKTGDIVNRAGFPGLQVRPQQSIALIGGNVFLQGNNGILREGGITAIDGNVVIAAIKSGKVSISPLSDFWSFDFKGVIEYGDISQTDGAFIIAEGFNSGSSPVQFQARNIIISDNGTGVFAFNLGDSQGNPLSFVATESLSLLNFATINTVSLESGNAGDIIVRAPKILLNDGSIRTSAEATGNAGNILLSSDINLKLFGRASLVQASTFNELPDSGNGGLIQINANRIQLIDGGRITNSTDGAGNAGNTTIQAKSIEISGFADTNARIPSGFFSQTNGGRATGAAGSIDIDTQSLTINNGGIISTGSTEERFITARQGFSQGEGGDIRIIATELVKLHGTGLDSDGNISPSTIFSGTVGQGDAGSVFIDTDRLFVLDGAQISSATIAEGQGGSINIESKQDVLLSGANSGLFASTSGSGPGGNIEVTAGKFRLQDNAVVDVRTLSNGPGGNISLKANSFSAISGGQLLSTTSGSQSAGDIKLNVLDSIILDGANSSVSASTTQGSTGAGGNIDIDPRVVLILNGAEINASSLGRGPAGNVFLQAGNLTLDRGNILATSTSGLGGNINLDIGNLLLLNNNSQISATAGNQNTEGDGGNITIDTDLLVALNDSDITANAFTGRGGNIQITTQGLFLSPNSDVTASSNEGIDGQVDIITPEVDPSDSLSELPESVESPQKITKGCRPGQAIGDSNFVHVGRGGLPPSPYEAQAPTTVWQDLRAENLQPSSITTTASSPTPLSFEVNPKIVEAKGWIKDSQGRIYLTANVPQPALNPRPVPTC